MKAEVIDYVLRKPKPEARDAIQETVAKTMGVLDLIAAGEMERATMKLNAKPPRPKPPRPAAPDAPGMPVEKAE